MPSQPFTDDFIQDLIKSLESARDEKLRAEKECERLRSIFRCILEASDGKMADGDFARQCAKLALHPRQPGK